MKSILSVVLLSCLFSSQSWAEVRISEKASGTPATLFEIQSIQYVQVQVDPNYPTRSFAEMRVRGVVEMNNCGYQNLAVQNTVVRHSTQSLESEIAFVPTSQQSLNGVEIGEEFCAAISQPADFTTVLRVSVNSWEENQAEHQWTYVFRDANETHGTLEVVFHRVKGWNFHFSK
jgi:hypothetical protein